MSDYNGEHLKFRFKEGDLERLESMYNYQSPIEMIATEMRTKYENECVSVCQRYGFNVDKDELAKALAYDRNQYDKGFKDGYKQALKEQQELRERIMNDENSEVFCSDDCSLCSKAYCCSIGKKGKKNE